MLNHVKNTTVISLFDLLAPHTCRSCGLTGSVLCDRCKKNILSARFNLCPICKSPNIDGICQKCHNFPPTFIVSKRTGLIDTLIHDYKYHSVRALAKPLATLLDGILPPINGNVGIIPLPTINRHIHERGFDHTELIAKHLVKLRGPNYQISRILIRNKNTIQVGANRTTRLSQAKEAYTISNKTKISPTSTYILLDDVWTTGASIKSAINLLQKADAKRIIVAILALSCN